VRSLDGPVQESLRSDSLSRESTPAVKATGSAVSLALWLHYQVKTDNNRALSRHAMRAETLNRRHVSSSWSRSGVNGVDGFNVAIGE